MSARRTAVRTRALPTTSSSPAPPTSTPTSSAVASLRTSWLPMAPCSLSRTATLRRSPTSRRWSMPALRRSSFARCSPAVPSTACARSATAGIFPPVVRSPSVPRSALLPPSPSASPVRSLRCVPFTPAASLASTILRRVCLRSAVCSISSATSTRRFWVARPSWLRTPVTSRSSPRSPSTC